MPALRRKSCNLSSVYPRHVGKRAAAKAFAKLRPDLTLLDVLPEAFAARCVQGGPRLPRHSREPDRPAPETLSAPDQGGVVRLAWLAETRRIGPCTIEAYHLASRDDWLMFPYLRDGELVAAKYRKLPKSFRQDDEGEPCL